MTSLDFVREADRVLEGEPAPDSGELDLSALEADWVSATHVPGGLSRVTVRQHEGRLLVRAEGTEGLRPGPWGEVPVDRVFSNALRSRVAYAIHFTFDEGGVRSHFQTYQGLGVLVMHGFHHFHDGSGRRNYFTREFFVPAHPGEQTSTTAKGALPEDVLTGRTDPSGAVAYWTNTDPQAKGIAILDCRRSGDGLTLRAHGVGAEQPVDWGEVETDLYVDIARPDDPPALLATYDHGFMRIHLQARVNRGIYVVCEYAEFTDGSGRPNYFLRECYRR